jgi:hypothetical protein
MFRVRKWERFQFRIDYEHRQVRQPSPRCFNFNKPIESLFMPIESVWPASTYKERVALG